MIPIIILNYNQLAYLKNLIWWWKWYYPKNPIYIVDNNSDYDPLLDHYYNLGYGSLRDESISVINFSNNMLWENLAIALEEYIEEDGHDYYFIAPADMMPHPNTPPNFLEIMQHCIESGYHHVGFRLILKDLPPFIENKEQIRDNENRFSEKRVRIEHKKKYYSAFKAPVDATLALYKKSDGWSHPMEPEKWDNSLRIFEAFHLPWYQHPDYVNEEMDNYYKTCKKNQENKVSEGWNHYRPKKYD